MKAYISELHLNNGEKIELNDDDIVVFVGSNNVGKSRALKDLCSLCRRSSFGNGYSDEEKTVIVKNIKLTFDEKETMAKEAVEQGWALRNEKGIIIRGDIYTEDTFINETLDGSFGSLYDSYVFCSSAGEYGDTSASSNYKYDDTRYDPIHFLSDYKELRQKASEGFRRAFDSDLLPNRMHGGLIPLCIGSESELDAWMDGKKGNEALDSYIEFMSKLPEIEDQSDGMRSFTSILVNLVLKHKKLFIMDEPESYLHPPQAQIMGQVIAEYIDGRQAFIATHSQDVIKGLLEADFQRVKIIRISRKGNINYFRMLENNDIIDLWKDPMLKYSDILNALFYEDVIICESDADCRIYGTMLSHLKRKAGKYLQVQFIPSNGKHRISKIVDAVNKMGIHCLAVIDIDLLSDNQDVKKTFEAFGGKWEDIEHDLKSFSNSLSSHEAVLERKNLKKQIDQLLCDSHERYLSNTEVEKITELLHPITKWKQLKKSGKSIVPAGDATAAFNRVIEKLKEVGIYIVEVGELENFVKEVGSHGPTWVSAVLDQYPDLDNLVYDDLKKFVSSWNL